MLAGTVVNVIERDFQTIRPAWVLSGPLPKGYKDRILLRYCPDRYNASPQCYAHPDDVYVKVDQERL